MSDKNGLEIKGNPAVTPNSSLEKEKAGKGDLSKASTHQEDNVPRKRPEISVSSSTGGNSLSPPDGGYGWFIVLGSFIMHIIIGGMERSEGVFFLQFEAKFHQSAQVTAWPGAISGSIRLLAGPIATAISNRYSIRTCCMIGSAFQFIGVFLNSFVSDFNFLFISHAFLTGIGRGLLYAPCLIIVNMYFDKRRSLSVGLAVSGVGVGSFIVVPLTQFLFSWYGYSGAFLIIAALNLHSFLVAMLFRPLSMHQKFTHPKRGKDQELLSLSENQNVPDDTVALNLNDNIERQPNSSALHDEHQLLGGCVETCKDCMAASFQICFPKESLLSTSKTRKKKMFDFYLLKDMSFLLFCISILLYTAAFKAAFTFLPALVKSKGYTDTEATFVLSIVGVADTISRILAGLFFDMACLQSCRTVLYNIFIFVLGIISFTLPSLDSYIALCIVLSLYGAFSGAYISQKSVMAVEILGPDKIALSFGMLVCFQGVGSAFGPPLSGAFKDAFGTFTEAFYFGGALIFFAGIIMISSNLFLKLCPSKQIKVVDKE